MRRSEHRRDSEDDQDETPRRERCQPANRRKLVMFTAAAGGLGVLLWTIALIVYLLPAGGAPPAAAGGVANAGGLEASYDRIRIGMSREEVERNLGRGTMIRSDQIPTQGDPKQDERLAKELRDFGVLPILRWREGSGQLVVGFVNSGGQDVVAFRGWFFQQGGTLSSKHELHRAFGMPRR